MLSTFIVSLFCHTGLIAHAGVIVFHYDPAGRLTTAAFDGGQSILHAYAPSGKLIQRQINPGPSPDSDTDGMTDAWEMLHFGTLARNGSGDFDGDGQSDVAEFFAGTLPASGASLLKVTSLAQDGLSIVTVEWAATAGKRYRLQYKETMFDPQWRDVPGDVVAAGATATQNDPTASSETQRYYRVTLIP